MKKKIVNNLTIWNKQKYSILMFVSKEMWNNNKQTMRTIKLWDITALFGVFLQTRQESEDWMTWAMLKIRFQNWSWIYKQLSNLNSKSFASHQAKSTDQTPIVTSLSIETLYYLKAVVFHDCHLQLWPTQLAMESRWQFCGQ